MKARIVQLINNFYRDKASVSKLNKKEPLGEFCVLGYYDALNVFPVEDGNNETRIWDVLNKNEKFQLDGNSNKRNIVCISEDTKKDDKFWENREQFIFLFITLIRIKDDMNVDTFIEKMQITNIMVKENQVAYYSYDHSEAIVFVKTNKYSEGIQSIMKLREFFSAFKLHTIFSIKESVLENYNKIKTIIQDETINVHLHCVVKDFKKAEFFLEMLEKRFGKNTINKYEVLGNYDWLIEINSVSIWKFLELYKMGELLTHTHDDFQNAFYNIETQILVIPNETQKEDFSNEQLD